MAYRALSTITQGVIEKGANGSRSVVKVIKAGEPFVPSPGFMDTDTGIRLQTDEEVAAHVADLLQRGIIEEAG